jgi:hypothetical protein
LVRPHGQGSKPTSPQEAEVPIAFRAISVLHLFSGQANRPRGISAILHSVRAGCLDVDIVNVDVGYDGRVPHRPPRLQIVGIGKIGTAIRKT